jgi:hypothetical protein
MASPRSILTSASNKHKIITFNCLYVLHDLYPRPFEQHSIATPMSGSSDISSRLWGLLKFINSLQNKVVHINNRFVVPVAKKRHLAHKRTLTPFALRGARLIPQNRPRDAPLASLSLPDNICAVGGVPGRYDLETTDQECEANGALIPPHRQQRSSLSDFRGHRRRGGMQRGRTGGGIAAGILRQNFPSVQN